MVRLLILADDLTGSLDTGVQFSKQNIDTTVSLDPNVDLSAITGEVAVIDTESRHIFPSEAGKLIYGIATRAKECGIPYLYKKTDSALRGNVGAELAAAARGYGSRLCFVPAFPQNGRTTVNGVQLLDGVPIHETVFGKDPFNPVTVSNVRELIEQQAGSEDIDIFDASTEDDLKDVALDHAKGYCVFAGCAGFAGRLSDFIDFDTKKAVSVHKCSSFSIISGSINDITLTQIKNASSEADICEPLSEEVLFEGKSPDLNRISGKSLSIFYASRDQYREGSREDVASNIASFAAGIFRGTGTDTAIGIFGGDTLFEFIKIIGCPIRPLAEIEPGVVLSQVDLPSCSRLLITKSGGLGSPETISVIRDYICG